MRLTVGSKIALGYLVALLALASIGALAYANLSRLLDANRMSEHTYVVLERLGEVGSLLKDAETGQRGYLLTGIDDYLGPYRQAVQQIDITLVNLHALIIDNPGQLARLDTLQAAIGSKLMELKETIALRRDKGLQPALAVVLTDRGRRDMDAIRTTIDEMKLEEQRLSRLRSDRAQANAYLTMAVVLYGVPSAVLAVLLAAWLITRNIGGPLGELAAAAYEISIGDLSPKLTGEARHDELGTLSRAFADMASSLRAKAGIATLISRGDLRSKPEPRSGRDELGIAFLNMVQNLREVIADLRTGSQVMSEVAATVSNGNNRVAVAADQTTTATVELATTISELRQTTELTSRRMAEVSESAVAAAEVAQSGQAAVRDAMRSMHDIEARVGVLAERTAQLTEKSLAVSGIVSTVNALAEQSAILAVNASIEAAHADEQGQGFAVVAQEMKSLATQSKHAVVQVRTILSEIQQLIVTLVAAAEQSSTAVASGVKRSEVAGDALVRMSDTAEANAETARQVAVAAVQQTNGVQQIATAIHQIRQGSSDNLASIRAIKQATEELEATGKRLLNIVEGFAT